MGYSGGGAIAILAASKRNDVTLIRTIAGNLDTDAFCKHHRVDPMEQSMNPSDFADAVSQIEQVHFVGARDKVVPPLIAQSYQRNGGRGSIVVVDDAEHEKGWEKNWPDLVRR